jgi:hypothetical protein
VYIYSFSFIIVLSCCFVSTYTWTQSVFHSPILLFCTYISLNTVSLSWSYPVVLYLHIPEHSQFYHSPILLFCIYIYLNTVSLSWSYPVVLYLHMPEHSQFIIVLSCCFLPTYTWTQSVYHSPILLFSTYIKLTVFRYM